MAMEQPRSLKGRFPFSFGVPSYIIPADIATNVKWLRGIVDEIELILFESEQFSNMPSPADIALFRELAAETGLRYNVHLPLDIDIASPDPGIRSRSMDMVERIMDLTAPLDPTSFVLHVLTWKTPDVSRWRATVRESLSRLRPPLRQFAVETLAWDLREIDDILQELGLSVCIDIGHLLLRGDDVPAVFDQFSGRVTMIHLHGVQAGKDHIALGRLGMEERAMISRTVRKAGYTRSLSLEVFSQEDLLGSVDAMEQMFAAGGG
jgi:sugar phosphate isomerase/epimerase